MSGIISNPSSLTKEKLKNELTRHNITLPASDSRKNVYVELYRKHFLQRQHSEFSSDEEISPVVELIFKEKKQGKVRRSLSPRKSPKPKMATDVTQFSDDELSQRLRDFGVDVGPILDSTRRVYQRKLAALLSGKVKAEPLPRDENEFSASDEDVDDSQDTEVIEEHDEDNLTERLSEWRTNRQQAEGATATYTQHQAEGATGTYSTVTTTTVTTRRGTRHDREGQHEDWRQTSAKTVDAPPPTQQIEKEPTKPTKRWLPIKVQIAILIIVAILIFLVIHNMDPAPKNPVSGKLGHGT